jgi:magnesium-transporting ATPase (P-type)
MNATFRDPLRPLFSASVVARVLAVAMICIGVMQGVAAALAYRPGVNDDSGMSVALMAISGAFLLLFGAICFVVGVYVRRRKFFAILAGMVVAAFLMYLMLYLLFDVGWDYFQEYPVPSSIMGLFAAGFGWLLIQLIRGFRALRRDPTVVHGFAPLMPAPPAEVKHE